MNRSEIAKFIAVSSVYLLSGGPVAAVAQTSVATSSGVVVSGGSGIAAAPQPKSLIAQRLASNFKVFAGSQENAISLVNGLRSGSLITLNSWAPTTSTGSSSNGSLSFTPPTHPMGWGEVRHTLTLVQRELAASGIASPSPSQLQATLMGGAIVTSSGRIITSPGVLTLRSKGMGWGRIALTLDVPMGRTTSILAFNHETPVVSASRPHVSAVTTANGEIIRARQWSDEGASHAQTGTDTRGALPPPVTGSRPPVATPAAAGFGLTTAGSHGGLGVGGRGR